MRALEPWVAGPLETFLAESAARVVLVMTSAGQVVAQHGFTRSLDVMSAAALGAGLYGIEHQLEPDEQVKGNAYTLEHPEHQALPRTLWDAAQRLKASTPARELFGDDFVEHFAATREWEERAFRKHITDWELDRYFEII